MPSNLMNELLKKAEEKKKAYLWFEAAQLLEKAAATSPRKTEQARIMESAGYCHSRASQQATSHAMFRERRKAAVQAYRKASELYRPIGGGKENRKNQ